MPTLGELMEKFGSAAASQNNDAGDNPVPAVRQNPAVGLDGHNKTASGGDMKSLTDIYLTLTQVDMNKEAAAAASAPTDDVDFAKMAEAMADAEATEIVQQDGGGNEDAGDIIKVAQEYDSAGRIMARGFFDEFQKLAGALDTAASENQNTESESKASTPALGTRGLPTMETNFAGSPNHDQPLETAGQAAKQVYLDSLAPTKSINAGAGTGDDPEAAAISLGSGSPAGFATVKDLQV
jgi:hypothetical protein